MEADLYERGAIMIFDVGFWVRMIIGVISDWIFYYWGYRTAKKQYKMVE